MLKEMAVGISHRWLKVLFLAVLCIAAYAPAFNNGFISDDFPNLIGAREFRADPFHLFSIPPQNFRVTTFILLAVGDSLFGDKAAFYYAFPLFFHFLNCLLLWKLLISLERPNSEAFLAGCLFAVFQAPQGAVMWLSASAEVMLALSILGMLILWIQRRYLLCALVYCVALVNKESAPVAILLIPLIDYFRGQGLIRRQYLVFVPPTLAFIIVFWWVSPSNPMIQANIYEFGPHAIEVLFRSLHRLIWPWLYILIIANRWISGRWIAPSVFLRALAILTAVLFPYLFLTYGNHLPSRHVYMSSIGLMGFMAWIIYRTPHRLFRQAFILTFILFNICYLWIRKDPQYEERSAPTTALIEILNNLPPTPIMIIDFPSSYPIIAKSVSQFCEGWTPKLIKVQGEDAPCESCIHFQWDPSLQKYKRLK